MGVGIPVVQQPSVPAEVLALASIKPDYGDIFTATFEHPVPHPAQAWARAGLEGSSRLGRFLAWQTALGFRLDNSDPECVAGWKIGYDDGRSIRLEANSWVVTGNMIFLVEGAEVSFATLLCYDRPPAGAIWTPMSAVHRRLAPSVLRGAASRLRKAPS